MPDFIMTISAFGVPDLVPKININKRDFAKKNNSDDIPKLSIYLTTSIP
jgi:hypothetical protein